VRRFQSGLRKDLDAVMSRTARDGVLQGAREVGSPATSLELTSFLHRLVRPQARPASPPDRFRYQVLDADPAVGARCQVKALAL